MRIDTTNPFYNTKTLIDTIKINSSTEKYIKKNRFYQNYGKNNNENNERYSGYNSYTNGNPSSLILQNSATKSHYYNRDVINYNDRLTQSVSNELKEVSGYLIPQRDIKVNIIKSNYQQHLKGVI